MEGADRAFGCKNVFVLGATNCPWELDTAFLRRFQKRVYMELPDETVRVELLTIIIQSSLQFVQLSDSDIQTLAQATNKYSGSDLNALVADALFEPVREMLSARDWLHDGQRTPINTLVQNFVIFGLA